MVGLRLMSLGAAVRLVCFLGLFAPSLVYGGKITISCPQRVAEPELTQSLDELFAELTEHPLSDSIQEVFAKPAREQDSLSSTDSDRLAAYLESMARWRARAEDTLFGSEIDTRPPVWVYPASGYDLASAVWMTNPQSLQTKTAVFLLVDHQIPFLAATEFGRLPESVEYSAENLSDNADASWAYSIAHKGLLRTRAQNLGGLLPASLSRMRAYFGDAFAVEKIYAIREKAFLVGDRVYPTSSTLSSMSRVGHPTHGVLTFRIGQSPTHYAVFLHASVATGAAKLTVGEWGARSIPLSLKIFGKVNGVLVKGSQGVLAPSPQQNHSRDQLLSILASNEGLLYEGNHQNPKPLYYEPDPDPEVTTEFGFIRGTHGVGTTDEILSLPLGSVSTSRVEDARYKWSYYEGARATRFRRSLP